MPTLWLPKHLTPAKKTIAVVFYWNQKLDRILVGFPENFPAPHGFQKIVCRTAAEVDRWSQKLRDQERRDDEMTDEQREVVEAPLREYARKELHNKMANSRNAINREFCRRALEIMDEQDRSRRLIKESFMHVEGFESGK